MPVKKDESGERSVEAEVEVPGTPEEVWAAIATGQGMSSWFVPSTSEERAGGIATNNFGPGMESIATIKEWNPPNSFMAETEEEPGKVATEWIVEAQDGGTCVVRVVHRWFAKSDEWDNQFEQHRWGWLSFFRILKLYLTYFREQPCIIVPLSAFTGQSVSDAWQVVTESLPIADDKKSVRLTPTGQGVVERSVTEEFPELLLRLDSPNPGVAHLFVMAMGPQTMLSVRLYLYGDNASGSAKGASEKWSQWLNESFPQTSHN